jgi:O-antigen ligase
MVVSLLRPIVLPTVRHIKLHRTTWLYLLLPIVAVAALIGREDIPVFLIARFAAFLEDRVAGVNEQRDAIHAAAWQDFLGSPLVGSSYVVSLEKSSPHNIVYEALISAGILGAITIAWALMRLALGVYRAWRGDAGPHGYPLALVGICLFVMQFTSGSIGQSPEFWVFTSLLVLLTEKSTRVASPPGGGPLAAAYHYSGPPALRKAE